MQINSFYSLPSFKEKFGDEKHGIKSIPTNWQTAYSTIGIPGSFIGLFLCGWCQERFGARKTYMSGMAACICVVFLFVFAQNKGMLLGTEAIAAGIWALFSAYSLRSRDSR
jgi:MFS transporter, SP family, general alpha glucoside:H+ symporter